MATTSRAKTDTAETPASAFRLPSFERATERIRNLNKEVITSSKKAGTVTLEVYEKSLNSLVEFERNAATASHVGWLSSLAATHTKLVTDLSSSYTAASRELLK